MQLGLDDFVDGAATDPAIRSLLSKIHMHDADLNAAYGWGSPRPAVHTVKTRPKVIHRRADSPPGSPGNFSEERLHGTVVDCVERGRITGSAKNVIASVEHLEASEDLSAALAPVGAP